MPETDVDALRERVGESMQTVQGLEVEAGKVVEFATAVGDENPVYRGVEDVPGLERIPAPLTFTWLHQFPQYRPSGVDLLGFDLGLDDRYVLHGKQEYEFERPVFVGDRLSGTTTLAGVERRTGGRAGEMTFVTYETEFVDATDERVATETTTVIETDGAVDDGASAPEPDDVGDDPDPTEPPSFATVSRTGVTYDRRLRPDDVSAGDTATMTVDGLTRGNFVRYAGASGDMNPLHYDQPYAQAAGNPDVFGQGMLSAGFAGALLSAWFGVDAVESFRNRFTARSWPGDTLTVTAEVVAVADPTLDVEFQVTRQNGETLIRGEATVDLSDRA